MATICAAACSSPSPQGGDGASCETPADCASNLDCVPQANGTRICSSNLGPIVHTEEAGADTGGGTGPTGDSGTAADTGGATKDSGAAKDTGTTAKDSGSTSVDGATD